MSLKSLLKRVKRFFTREKYVTIQYTLSEEDFKKVVKN